MVEARSDQPGVPAFENLSIAKAVQYVVSALRVFAVKGPMQRQVISVSLWRHWRFLGVFQFCNSPEPVGTWLPRLARGNCFQVSMHFYKCVSPRESPGCPEEWPLWTRRKGVCRTYPMPGYKQLTASVGGLGQSYLPRLAELLNSMAHAAT